MPFSRAALVPPFSPPVRFGAFFAGAPNMTSFVFPTTIVFRVVNMGTMGVWVWMCGCVGV